MPKKEKGISIGGGESTFLKRDEAGDCE